VVNGLAVVVVGLAEVVDGLFVVVDNFAVVVDTFLVVVVNLLVVVDTVVVVVDNLVVVVGSAVVDGDVDSEVGFIVVVVATLTAAGLPQRPSTQEEPGGQAVQAVPERNMGRPSMLPAGP
jgi:hypothetical protein